MPPRRKPPKNFERVMIAIIVVCAAALTFIALAIASGATAAEVPPKGERPPCPVCDDADPGCTR
jgi:hypothetical protein